MNFTTWNNKIGVLASPQYLFEGAKIELQSNLSPNFQVTHLMSFASQANPNQYIFGAVYGGARVIIKILNNN